MKGGLGLRRKISAFEKRIHARLTFGHNQQYWLNIIYLESCLNFIILLLQEVLT